MKACCKKFAALEILWRSYLDPKSDDLMSEENSFPDIRYLTGNYYVESERYGYIYRDSRGFAYHIKNGQFRALEPAAEPMA